MNEHQQRWTPLRTLVLLALASGFAWRAELELRSGWAGLVWASYFHWAVPICVLAFLVWVARTVSVTRSIIFLQALLAFGVLAYLATSLGFQIYFGTGMYEVFLFPAMFLGNDAGKILRKVVPFFWPLFPLIFCAICQRFGVRIKTRWALLSAVLFTISWPVAIFIRSFVDGRGGSDVIHALKSGYVIPFLVVSLGLPLIYVEKPVNKPSSPR